MRFSVRSPFALLLFFFAATSLQAVRVVDTLELKKMLQDAWGQMYQQPDSAQLLSEQALEIAQDQDMPDWEAKAMNQVGVIYWVKAEYDSALVWLERAFETYTEAENAMGKARVSNNFGLVYMAMDYYELALRSFQDALPVFEEQDKPVLLSNLYNNLGMVANAVRDYDEAIVYFEKAMVIAQERGNPADSALLNNNLGLTYRDAGEMEKANFYHANAVDGYRKQENYHGMIESLYNYGGYWALIDSFPQADALYQEALSVARDYGNAYTLAAVWVKITELKVREENYPAAIAAGDSTLAYLEEGHGPKAWKAIAEALALAHEKVGNYDKAYQYATQVTTLADSILSSEIQRNVEELTVQYETELKDQEILNLKEREAYQQQRVMGLGIIITLVLVVFALVFLRQRKAIRREKALQEKTREAAEAKEALAQSEIRATQLESQALEEEVRHKTKEISNLALGIIRHHELLGKLDQELQTIRRKADPTIRQEVQDLAVMVNSQLGVEKERQDLQLYIEEAEQKFFQVLDSRFPQLTKRERRLCALIRMGYSSKEIAALFNINPTSVDQGRYRLRKKLDPDMELPLSEYLDQLMQS